MYLATSSASPPILLIACIHPFGPPLPEKWLCGCCVRYGDGGFVAWSSCYHFQELTRSLFGALFEGKRGLEKQTYL